MALAGRLAEPRQRSLPFLAGTVRALGEETELILRFRFPGGSGLLQLLPRPRHFPIGRWANRRRAGDRTEGGEHQQGKARFQGFHV